MRKSQLPITALPAWSKLNDASFIDINVQNLGDAKGFGLATEKALSSKDTFDVPTLLIVPHDLILSAEAIEEHAKVDQHFRQLLDVAGGKSLRGDVVLFLLMQITIGSSEQAPVVGVSNPWTEYVRMLPSSIPLPTMWTEEERVMLVGTSLETALPAKMSALLREFESLREKTVGISWCEKCWWQRNDLIFSDWILLDAWFRSRSLELPKAGESMVPCLDMTNHSFDANAYYEQTSENSVALLLRPDMKVDVGAEITISYGTSKRPAEMLFSYGFIDEQSDTNTIVLPLEPFGDDPLGKAKLAAFAGRPVVEISLLDGEIKWESPFLYFMCLNEEDGLEFKVLQQNDGSRSQLRVFWHGADVTEQTTTFEALVCHHELKDIFSLRVVALLHDRIRQQLERLYESEDVVQSLALVERSQSAALQLRKTEARVLEAAFTSVDMQKNKLLETEGVLRFLGAMEGTEPPENGRTELSNDDDDFS